MSKAGRKIIKGLKEAHAVGGTVPGVRFTVSNSEMTYAGRCGLLAWLSHMLDTAGDGRAVKITLEFSERST